MTSSQRCGYRWELAEVEYVAEGYNGEVTYTLWLPDYEKFVDFIGAYEIRKRKKDREAERKEENERRKKKEMMRKLKLDVEEQHRLTNFLRETTERRINDLAREQLRELREGLLGDRAKASLAAPPAPKPAAAPRPKPAPTRPMRDPR